MNYYLVHLTKVLRSKVEVGDPKLLPISEEIYVISADSLIILMSELSSLSAAMNGDWRGSLVWDGAPAFYEFAGARAIRHVHHWASDLHRPRLVAAYEFLLNSEEDFLSYLQSMDRGPALDVVPSGIDLEETSEMVRKVSEEVVGELDARVLSPRHCSFHLCFRASQCAGEKTQIRARELILTIPDFGVQEVEKLLREIGDKCAHYLGRLSLANEGFDCIDSEIGLTSWCYVSTRKRMDWLDDPLETGALIANIEFDAESWRDVDEYLAGRSSTLWLSDVG